jgi:ketosteroid isomerase-like protein
MKNLWILVLIALLHPSSKAQNQADIRAVIDGFFVAMEAKDTLALDSLLHDQCILFSTLNDKNGRPHVEVLRKVSLLGFMRRAIIKGYVYHEQLWTYDISREDNLATAWTEYTLFAGEPSKVSHCGINTFTLAKTATGQWQIVHIADTRRQDNCLEEGTVTTQTEAVHKHLDDWHQAAATANEDAFYGAMAKDCIYLGTDASERWLRDELREWAKFAFEREVAWAFTPSKRQLYWGDNQRVVWFEEMLDTQMGTCRGSGVLVKESSGWTIKHYDLAIMVPNDLVKDFLKLVEMGGLSKKKKKKKTKK